MKLVIVICVLFVFTGTLIYVPLSTILPQRITVQIIKKDVEIAKYLANEAKDLLLLNNRVALSLLLYDNLDRLEDAQYLFIQSPSGCIIAHTFGKGFPKGLLSFGSDPQRHFRVKEFLNNGRKVYDIAAPVAQGGLGTLHLGVSMESGKKDIAGIKKINYYVAIVILTGLGIGISAFLIIGLLFSKEIIKLRDFAAKIGEGELEAKIDIDSNDEIGTLASAFNEMALRLKENIQEVKRLNTIDERNRIALDLHDGSAQDMASIIKRLELCEKLFEKDPRKAFEEMELLRENAKDILNRMRQVIFDLKSPKDEDFSLIDKLANHIMTYEKTHGINVKMDVGDSVGDIQLNKAKSIFYIIAEALSNVRKHSSASNVAVDLKIDSDRNLLIDIKDNGQGFDINDAKLFASKHGKWGLINMRQRAEALGGICNIESRPQEGTRVFVNIPLEKNAAST